MRPILLEVFSRQIASYGVSIVIGAAAAWLLVFLLSRKHGKKKQEQTHQTSFELSKTQALFRDDQHIWMAFLICICGGLIGSVLLRAIMKIPELFMNWETIRQMSISVFLGYMFGEVVFYGGLIGGVLALLIYCKGFKVKIVPLADLFAPGIALAHAIGRIGCFFGGCCYGIHIDASHPFAVVFPPESLGAPPGVPLLAIQLIEAACLFVIATIISVVYKLIANKKNSAGNEVLFGNGFVVLSYGILYSITRFILEFYRGDLIRGVYGALSTSQYISLGVFTLCITLLLIKVLAKKRVDNGN